MNKSPIILILMVSLVVSVGCAKSDWIQQTLVTVDVTGTWRSSEGPLLEFVLEQQGANVKGSYRLGQSSVTASIITGELTGTVAGDVFRFNQVSGTGQAFGGEMTVGENEMKGGVRGASQFFQRRPITLQRVSGR